MKCYSCYRRSATSQWKIYFLVLTICICSRINLIWLDSCLVVAGPAFLQTSHPRGSPFASSSSARCYKKRGHDGPQRPTKRRPKEKLDKNYNIGSTNMNNLLSNMGLHQVNTTTNISNTAANNPLKKKRKKNAAAGQEKLKFPGISLQTQLDYARNGHGVLRNFVTDGSSSSNNRLVSLRDDIVNLATEEELKAWVQKVQVAAGNQNNENFESNKDFSHACRSIEGCQKALHDMGVTASLPFLQYFNTWRKLPAVKDLAFNLGEAASILLDVPTVRLYQDAVFWKRNRDGPTPWHADARMAPFDTSNMITFWIPLQGVPSPRDGGTALLFCSKSHADFALPYWNPPEENNVCTQPNTDENDNCVSAWDRLNDRYPKKVIDYMPMSLGDVTVHSGWTLHCSNGNEIEGSKDRLALAITFVDGAAETRPNWETIGDDEDRWSYQDWCKEIRPLTKISHELVPIVWPPSRTDDTK